MTADDYAKILWDYQKLNEPLEPADAVMVLGSHDFLPPQYGIELFKKGYGKYLLFSGGVIVNKPEIGVVMTKTEAETYKEIALQAGIPEDKIIVENKSLNTGANIQFSMALVKEKYPIIKTFLIVQKPYMERRIRAVVEKQAPEITFFITSKPLTYEEYTSGSIPKDYIINAMVADMQRIKIYGENEFQTPQEIPEVVWTAYLKLVGMGYTKKMVKN